MHACMQTGEIQGRGLFLMRRNKTCMSATSLTSEVSVVLKVVNPSYENDLPISGQLAVEGKSSWCSFTWDIISVNV